MDRWHYGDVERLFNQLPGVEKVRTVDRDGERIAITLNASDHLLVRHPDDSDYDYELCHVRDPHPGTLPFVERIAQVNNTDVLVFLIRQVLAEGGRTPGVMRWTP